MGESWYCARTMPDVNVDHEPIECIHTYLYFLHTMKILHKEVQVYKWGEEKTNKNDNTAQQNIHRHTRVLHSPARTHSRRHIYLTLAPFLAHKYMYMKTSEEIYRSPYYHNRGYITTMVNNHNYNSTKGIQQSRWQMQYTNSQNICIYNSSHSTSNPFRDETKEL